MINTLLLCNVAIFVSAIVDADDLIMLPASVAIRHSGKEENMTIHEALTHVGDKLDPEVRQLLGHKRKFLHKEDSAHVLKQDAKEEEESPLAKARNTLNKMYGESFDEYDLTQADCASYKQSAQEQMDSNTQTRAQAAVDVANGRAEMARATGTIKESELGIKKTQGQIEVHDAQCAKSFRSGHAQLAILEADYLVAERVVNMTTCGSSDAASLLQCTSPGGHSHFRLHGNVHKVVQAFKSKEASMAVDRALSYAFARTTAHHGRSKTHRHAGKFTHRQPGDEKPEEPVEEEGTSITDIVENTPEPIPVSTEPEETEMVCKKNPFEEPSEMCALINDAMAQMAGEIKMTLETLRASVAAEEENCRLLSEKFDAQLADSQKTLSDSNTLLAEATETVNEGEETLRLKVEEFNQLSKEYRAKMKECREKMRESMDTMCAIRKVRLELSEMKGDGTIPYIQDCEVGEWVEEACSVTCGGGTQKLVRDVITQPHLGEGCPALEMERPCADFPCPIDCQLDDWTGWSKCSKDCGGGVQQRVRNVLVEMEHNGVPCDETTQSRTCNNEDCDAPCILEPWSEWSSCDKVCNKGHNSRVRKVLTPARGDGLCADQHDPTRFLEEECNDVACPSFLVCESELDLVIILDGSGSVGEDGFAAEKAFANSILDHMEMGPMMAKVGVVLFAGHSTIVSQMTHDKEALKEQINNLEFPRTTTDTAGALSDAANVLTSGGRPEASSIAFVLTDGDPNDPWMTREAAEKLQTQARVIFVPIGHRINMENVESWATYPGRDNVLPIDDFSVMESKLSAFISDMCPIASSFCPSYYSFAGGDFDGSGEPLVNMLDSGITDELGDIGGGFSIRATVRMDELTPWAPIIDFSNGPGVDAILLSAVGESTALGFYVVLDGWWAALEIPDFWVIGSTVDVLAVVSATGHMSVYSNGELLGELDWGYAPAQVARTNYYLGRSSWPGEVFKGSITGVKVWNDAIGVDCQSGEGTTTPAPED